MNPASFNSSSSSPLHFIDLNEDDHQHLISNPPQQQLLPSSSLSCPIFFNLSQHHYQSGSTHPRESLQNQNKVEKFGLLGGSSESKSSTSSSGSDDGLSVKWMSSKMRVMRKMMAPNSSRTDKSVVHKFNDHRSEINSNIHHYSSTGIVRVCSDCNTTKTPLWRGGPQGPKSLCNACGIRQRKARKAMALAAAAANATTQTDSSTSTNKTQDKQGKKSHTSYVVQPKHVNLGGTNCPRNTRKHISFEDFALSLISKNSTNFQGVLPQDEEEAAILLMALSCGLTHN